MSVVPPVIEPPTYLKMLGVVLPLPSTFTIFIGSAPGARAKLVKAAPPFWMLVHSATYAVT